MQEVTATLKFATPCLGAIRRGDDYVLEHDAAGNVVFMHNRWRRLFAYGAQICNRCQSLIDDIRVDSRVCGTPCRHRRYYRAYRYSNHEAFAANQEIRIRALLPDRMSVDDFRQILQQAGRFNGISPWGWKDGFGRFDVTAVDVDSSRWPPETGHE